MTVCKRWSRPVAAQSVFSERVKAQGERLSASCLPTTHFLPPLAHFHHTFEAIFISARAAQWQS